MESPTAEVGELGEPESWRVGVLENHGREVDLGAGEALKRWISYAEKKLVGLTTVLYDSIERLCLGLAAGWARVDRKKPVCQDISR